MKELDAKQCIAELAERGLVGTKERRSGSGGRIWCVRVNGTVILSWTEWWDRKRDPSLGGLLRVELPADSALARARARQAERLARGQQ